MAYSKALILSQQPNYVLLLPGLASSWKRDSCPF